MSTGKIKHYSSAKTFDTTWMKLRVKQCATRPRGHLNTRLYQHSPALTWMEVSFRLRHEV